MKIREEDLPLTVEASCHPYRYDARKVGKRELQSIAGFYGGGYIWLVNFKFLKLVKVLMTRPSFLGFSMKLYGQKELPSLS